MKNWKQWAKFAIVCGLYVWFLLWIKAGWWAWLVIPFIFDIYLTKKIKWTWWRDLENPVTRTVMSWVDAIVFALVAVYFVNIYFFQNYTIPSSSLEKSLLVGDYLYVSKMTYGPRVPQTPLHMPLTQHTMFGGAKSYLEWIKWDYKRVAPKRVTLNDIVVFNYPAGDTVASNYQNADYYDICYTLGRQQIEAANPVMPIMDSLSLMDQRRLYEMFYATGRHILRANPMEFGEILARPVDRRENYVKRCVGLPGQTLEIRDHIIYLDGVANKEPDNVQYNYRIRLKNGAHDLPAVITDELELSDDDLVSLHQVGVMPLTAKAHDRLLECTNYVESIEMEQDDDTNDLYPLNGNTGWTKDNYGPIWIPAKGETIELTLENLPIYERPIRIYEGNKLEVTPQGDILINDTVAHSYTFGMDYYWMMGDNRHCSADSRYWGFVPEDHVVGKPIMIWLSTNKDKSWFHGHIRWNRLFRWVDYIK